MKKWKKSSRERRRRRKLTSEQREKRSRKDKFERQQAAKKHTLFKAFFDSIRGEKKKPDEEKRELTYEEYYSEMK